MKNTAVRKSAAVFSIGNRAFLFVHFHSMPELPEVELVTRFLHRVIIGRSIKNALLVRSRLAPNSRPAEFQRDISNSKINSVARRGKYILFDLDNGRTLVTHLRMSGRFLLLQRVAQLPKFVHAIFELDRGEMLLFQDQRHFGFMRVARTLDVPLLPEIAKLAPEPFTDDFSAAYLHSSLKRTRRPIKEFLLDQSRVCGLGNIYASEALFMAGIHPAQRANKLSARRSALLHKSIRKVLFEAIKAGSTLNIDPSDSDTAYYGGAYESYWRVYDREGQNCVACTHPIKRLKQGGRSTFYCQKCQRR